MLKYLSIIILLLYGCTSKSTNRDEASSPPNILFIMSDDHAYQAISAYGGRLAEVAPTPNLDRLAKEGMLFRNAYVTNSICAPSRATILTGKYSHLNGVIDNHTDFDSTQRTFPKLLQKAGYQTAVIGKWHLKSQPTGFDYWNIFPGHGQGKYYNPDFTEMGREYQVEGYATDIITDLTLDWLKDGRKKDKPFLLLYQHKAPHRSWEPAIRHFDYLEDVTIPLPDNFHEDYEKRGKAAEEQRMTIYQHMGPESDLKLDPEVAAEYNIPGNHPLGARAYHNKLERYTAEQKQKFLAAYQQRTNEFLSQKPSGKELAEWKYQQYMKDYLRCIKAVDENVGRVLDYLEESGLAENTLVVYTSDQGFYLGEHGWYDKRFMYEESFRTPLLVRWPGKVKAAQENTNFVMNLDFASTFLDIANAPIPEDIQGESMLPVLTGNTPADWRQSMYYHYYEYPGPHSVKRHYGIRSGDYKLIHFYHDVDYWEMYDLQKDPQEMNNVFADPAYSGIKIRLQGELEKLQHQYGDSDDLAKTLIKKKVH